jgi:pilus biogenesis lipoprotein CpaD
MNQKNNNIKILRLCRVMFGLTMLGLLVACAEKPGTPRVISQQSAIDAELVTFGVNLKFHVKEGKAFANDEINFRRYIKEYLQRGRSKLNFATAASANNETEHVVLSRLISGGIPPDSIVIKRGQAQATDAQGVEFSFQGYVISVPKCGNWFGETGHNPSNSSHVNFGCSYYRNLGLMLSDPGDLRSPQGIIASDARRMDNVIRVYRDGSAAGADRPKSEAANFAGPSSN